MLTARRERPNLLRFAGVVRLVLAVALALGIGLLATRAIMRARPGRGLPLDVLLMLPLGTSAVTLGFGFLVALDSPVDLRASFWLLPIAHSLIAVPFVVDVGELRRVKETFFEVEDEAERAAPKVDFS